MGLDGTTKTEALDDFHRDWPNIIVADEKTIEAVDKKWDCLVWESSFRHPLSLFVTSFMGRKPLRLFKIISALADDSSAFFRLYSFINRRVHNGKWISGPGGDRLIF